MPSSLRSTLLKEGRVGDLAFIATKTDLLTPSEVSDNLSLASDTSAVGCAAARNAFTKASVSRDFYSDMPTEHLPSNRQAPSSWSQLGFEFPV